MVRLLKNPESEAFRQMAILENELSGIEKNYRALAPKQEARKETPLDQKKLESVYRKVEQDLARA